MAEGSFKQQICAVIMAPAKFGLFKTRSRDSPEQPSMENLVSTSLSHDQVATASSPIPSTSKGITEDAASAELSTLTLYSDDDILSTVTTPSRSSTFCSGVANSEVDYYPYKNLEDSSTPVKGQEVDDASTTYDANSLQFDDNSIASNKDVSVKCRRLKKEKKVSPKTARLLRDRNMWKASNLEVMQNLLRGCGTVDEQIKWEAIATARGLCTLTDNCTCRDCTGRKFLAGMADGDGGLGAAPPLMSAFSLGCRLQ